MTDNVNGSSEKSEFLRRVQERTLSTKHQQLAQYIARHYRTAAALTAAQLGAEMGTSEATVIRLARELGYEGFPELRRQLHGMIREDLNSLELLARERSRSGRGRDALSAMVTTEVNHLNDLAVEVSRPDFIRLVQGLVDAKRVYIAGHRASASLAHFFGYSLAKVHPDVVTLAGESDTSFDAFRTVPANSWMVAIGFARYPRQTVELVDFARHEGITVGAITDRVLSPLARRADLSLIIKADPVSFVDSHCAPSALIAALLVEYGMVAHAQTETMLRRFERIVELRGIFHSEE
ncbi:MAG: MurR/RpiR family transcriptional regulator [Candidatus Binataceae bacterium]